MISLWLVMKLANDIGDGIVQLAIWSMVLGIVIGWVMFITCVSRRFRGSSLVFLIIGYPLLQTSICFAVFFLGCIAILAIG